MKDEKSIKTSNTLINTDSFMSVYDNSWCSY